jgi:tRNA(adenine34) deaminase
MSAALSSLAQRLQNHVPNPRRFPQDPWVLLAVQEALAAALEGNFGIGAVLLDAQGALVTKGHNQVFSPYFRSEAHAEMVVLNAFESAHRDVTRVGKYTLISSLEPCPMCFARLLTAGIGHIFYAARDIGAGMVSQIENLPPVWKSLAEGKELGLAKCSPDLQKFALEVFLATTGNDQRLKDRASSEAGGN